MEGTESITPLVQELYTRTANAVVYWDDDENFKAMDLSLSLAQSKLRRDRNANLPIMRIPPEVMAIIFRLVQASTPLTKPDPIVPHGPLLFSYHWLALAHVCFYWRAITTSCATLWSTFDLPGDPEHKGSGNIDMSIPQIFLANSRTVPLSVQIQAEGLSTLAWDFILPQLNRIRVLCVYGTVEDDILARLANEAAQELEQLEWHVPYEGVPDTATLPRSFLARCPRLTSLELTGLVDFGARTFHSLRQLHLRGQSLVDTQSLSLLRDCLAANAGIEDLCFTRTVVELPFTVFGGAHTSAEYAVTLPHLRRLAFVETSMESITTMLAILNLQGSDRPLALTCEALRDSSEGVFENLDEISDLLAHYPPPSIQYREVNLYGDTSRGLFTVSLSEPDHSLCLTHYEDTKADIMTLPDLLDYFIRHVEVLSLRFPPADTLVFEETIPDLFSVAPAVQVVRVHFAQDRLLDLWEAIATCYPALREVHLQLTALPSDVSDGLYELLAQAAMSRALARRKKAGRQDLQYLHLYAPPNTEDDPDLPKCAELVKSMHLDHVRDIQFHADAMPAQASYPPICSTPQGLWPWPGCGPA